MVTEVDPGFSCTPVVVVLVDDPPRGIHDHGDARTTLAPGNRALSQVEIGFIPLGSHALDNRAMRFDVSLHAIRGVLEPLELLLADRGRLRRLRYGRAQC